MATYLTVKAASDGLFSKKSAEALKKTARLLIEKYNLTYSCFLYPYIDAHALYCRDARISVPDNLLVVRADKPDKEDFERELLALRPLCGVCWYFSEEHPQNIDPQSAIFSTYDRGVKNKKENVFLFGAGTCPELFSSPDYIVREYSRRVCTFLEIASRDVQNHGGEIIFCAGEKLCFSYSGEGTDFIKNRIFGNFTEKMGEYLRFSNKYFYELKKC
ncbi:MAG: hypothetical protein IJL87_02980 [Clostridia bacterium]|nr:hypothetical protein [Clostridia bacterium]